MMKNMKKTVMSKLLWDCQDPEIFARRLNQYCYIRRRPLHVSWEKETETFRLHSDSGSSIHIGRINRIKEKYLVGGDRLREIYDRYLLQNINFSKHDVVIDVGANIGELSLYLVRHFGIFPVCCEPDPIEISCLKANFVGYDFMLYPQALWCQKGELEFFLDNDHGDSSLIDNGRQPASIKVECNTLDSLYSDLKESRAVEKIKLLKLEAEGAEPEILKGGEQMLQNVHYVSADLGPERGSENKNTVPQCVNFLLRMNFSVLAADTRRSIFLFSNNRLR